MSAGPITKNGRHPMGANVVHDCGVKGSALHSTPKASQLTSTNTSAPPVTKPTDTNGVLANNMQGEVKQSGTTSAERFYPKKLGLRGGVA